MRGETTSFGRRRLAQRLPVVPEAKSHAPGRDAIWIAGALTIAATGALIFATLPHRAPRNLSAADSAAIDQVVAGREVTLSALEGIPGVTVEYYEVDGTDKASIRRQMIARGPIDADGRRFDAHTRWRYRWEWRALADGSCGAANADVRFYATIRLPHLTRQDALSPGVAKEWKAYMTALVFHEAGHVRNGYGGFERVASAVRSASCTDANAAGERILDLLRREDRRFDARTRHGVKDGATFG